MTPDTCTTCSTPLHGPGLKIGAQTLCAWCGEAWTLPVHGPGVTLKQIVAERGREEERKKAA